MNYCLTRLFFGLYLLLYFSSSAFSQNNTIYTDTLLSNQGVSFYYENFKANLGKSITTLDFNGDGLTDLAFTVNGLNKVKALIWLHPGTTPAMPVNLTDSSYNVIYIYANMQIMHISNAQSFLNTTTGKQTLFIANSNYGNQQGVGYFITHSMVTNNRINLITNPSSAIKIEGLKNEVFGLTSSYLGDINNDGFGEFGIKAGSGLHIIYGNSNLPQTLNTSQLQPYQSFIPAYQVSSISKALAPLGDLNNDGFDDFIFTDFLHFGSYILWGSSFLPDTIWLNNSKLTKLIKTGEGVIGYALSRSVNINGSAYTNVLISGLGIKSEAKAFLLFPLTNNWPQTIDFNQPNVGFQSTELYSYNNNAAWGVTASTIGHFTPNGYQDFVICGHRDSSVNQLEPNGKCAVIFGKTGFGHQYAIDSLNHQNGLYLIGKPGSNFGFSVTHGFIFNHDSLADVAISAPFESLDNFHEAGKVYVFFGKNYHQKVGISEVKQNAVRIIPNPVNEQFRVISSKKIKQIQLFLPTGKLVFTVYNNQQNFNTQHLNNGIYNLKVVLDDGEIVNQQVIIAR